MPRAVNYNDRALIVGKTQAGKSTFARKLFAGMTGARRLLVNVKGRVRVGPEPVRSVAAIDWRAPIVDFVPATLEADVFEELYRAVVAVGGPTVVWLDEAYGATKAGFAPVYLRVLQQQGAELGLGHLVCSQRPVNIATELRSEADHVFIFGPPPHRPDLELLALELGLSTDRLAARIRDLRAHRGDFAFLWYSRAGDELTDCAPLDARWATAPIAAAGNGGARRRTGG